jgi:enoyl-CoA hydratase/carnithine racemase
VAAVGGGAVAGGLELLLCCDLVIAARGVQIGDGHVRYAIVPTAGATLRLSEKIGPARAAEMFYTEKLMSAETLRDWGLMNEVVDGTALLQRAKDLAGEISQCNPEAIRRIKGRIHPSSTTLVRSTRMAAEIDEFKAHTQGKELAIGLKAFRGKQQPSY